MPVPIIDLFAGPGGLGEGFASLHGHKRQPFFEIALSIEKDAVAHRTLTLRAVFRRLRAIKDVKHYYSYIRREIDEAAFHGIPAVASAVEHAASEARCLELGNSDEISIDREIRGALNGQETWVLIGGPPCQAHSLAGRSRRANYKDFHMENAKGLLSSKYSGAQCSRGHFGSFDAGRGART